MRKSRRPISKSKMYGFNPYVDQLDDINRIVAESGAKEATVLRKLIDEALMARRRKVFDEQLEEPTTEQSASERLEAIEEFLSDLAKKSKVSLRVYDISLALLQEILAEARAARHFAWSKEVETLKRQGLTKVEIAKRFDHDTDAGKDFAYGVAQDLKREQDPKRAKSKEGPKLSS